MPLHHSYQRQVRLQRNEEARRLILVIVQTLITFSSLLNYFVSLLKTFIQLSSHHVLSERFDFHDREADTRDLFSCGGSNNMWQGFKYELKRFYESCPHEK